MNRQLNRGERGCGGRQNWSTVSDRDQRARCNFLSKSRSSGSKTNSASSDEEHSLTISWIMNLFNASITSSSCPLSSFLWASSSTREAPWGAQQGVHWSHCLVDLGPASHWESLSCWRPLWTPYIWLVKSKNVVNKPWAKYLPNLIFGDDCNLKPSKISVFYGLSRPSTGLDALALLK